jgi:hypothetical protein
LDHTLKDIEDREKLRLEQAKEWKRMLHEYNVNKPLYKIKEEEF